MRNLEKKRKRFVLLSMSFFFLSKRKSHNGKKSESFREFPFLFVQRFSLNRFRMQSMLDELWQNWVKYSERNDFIESFGQQFELVSCSIFSCSVQCCRSLSSLSTKTHHYFSLLFEKKSWNKIDFISKSSCSPSIEQSCRVKTKNWASREHKREKCRRKHFLSSYFHYFHHHKNYKSPCFCFLKIIMMNLHLHHLLSHSPSSVSIRYNLEECCSSVFGYRL